MAGVTRATQALDRAGIGYARHRYAYDPGADRVGLAAAEALGVAPGMVLKTLMVLADARPACVILPADREAAMKRVAAALGAKAAAMMPPADAERLTGYKIGGISPFGHPRVVPVLLEEGALALPEVFVNGGQRGLQLRITPQAIVTSLAARVAWIVA